MRKKVVDVRQLIKDFLSSNKDKNVLFQKKGYRTYRITGGELFKIIGRIRALFEDLNIKRGDKIIIIGINSIELVSVQLACILSGVTFVPLDIMTDNKLFKKIKNKINAKVVFADKRLNLSKTTKTFYFEDLDSMLPNNQVHKNINIKQKDILEIVFTSGSTGNPKGVVITYENVNNAIYEASDQVYIPFSINVLNLLPLSHIFSQIYGLFLAINQNHSMYFIDAILPRKIITFIKYKKINALLAVPGILEALKRNLKNRFPLLAFGPQFRIIDVGGASLDKELEDWWKKRLFIVSQGYGMTETTSVISANKIFHGRKGSVGQLVEGVTVKIGDGGEILVKGKNVSLGYYKDKEKTKQSNDNGWLKTGDIGELKKGYLYIKGRKKDIIITGSGLNVYPADIEKILEDIPGVKDNCVIEKDGKIHAVLITRKNGSSVIKKANKKLLDHQKIQSFTIWPKPEFPKTSLGKTKKFVVKQKISSGKKSTEMYDNKLYDLVSKVLKPSVKIKKNSNLVDLGMDSLKRIELVAELEQEYDCEIDESKLDQNVRIKDVKKIIKNPPFIVPFRFWQISWPVRLLRFFARIISHPFYLLFIKTKFKGTENLEVVKKGPVIYTSNHQSNLDAFVLLHKLSPKTAVAAHPKFTFGYGFGNNTLQRIIRRIFGYVVALFLNAYIFGEGYSTDKSLEDTGEFIDRGFSILIFPEGHISKDGKMLPLMKGIGFMAKHYNVPIIPIKIEGMHKVLNVRTNKFSLKKNEVRIGNAIHPNKFKNVSIDQANKIIENSIRKL